MQAPDLPVVWGLFTRGVGLVYLIAFISLLPQVVANAGVRGVFPIGLRLTRIRADFSAPRRYLYFPTLLWLRHTDGTLRAVAIVGVLSAVAVVVGGPHSPWALALCFLCLHTLDFAMRLYFPWDCMLLEVGFFAVLLDGGDVGSRQTRKFPRMRR